MKRKKELIAAVVGALSATVLAGGVAWAAIPDAGGVIHGCYKRNLQTLRVAESPSDCKANEVAISWNQQGQKGDPGLTGPAGRQGDKGDTGERGPEGLQGLQGIQGAQGIQGLPGQDGAPGQPGQQGQQGPPGVSGIEHVVAHGVATQGGMFGRFPLEARCSAGKKVLGGGFGGSDAFRAISDRLAVQSSEPSVDHGGWYVFVTNLVALPADEAFDVWAICANA